MESEKKIIENLKTSKKPHLLKIEDNNKLTASGVFSVKSYNEKEVVLTLNQYYLAINGEGLNIDKLDTEDGNVAIAGLILGLKYLKAPERGSFFKKLAK